MADIVNIPNNSPTYKTWASDSAGSDTWTISQNWTYHEAYEWILDIRETIGIKEERLRKDPEKCISEALTLLDGNKAVFNYDLLKYELLNFDDSLNSSTTFIKSFFETLAIADTPSNWPQLPFEERFSIFDTMVQPLRGVVSDMLFESGSWDMDSMQDYMYKGKHVGYDIFRTFVAGDYTYDSALFRVALDAYDADRAAIEQFIIDVDVPDIMDRGSASVADKNFPQSIKFNRTFHIAPEVTITMRSGVSGTPIVPVVDSVTETGFVMHLMNAVTGENTVGDFIWSATGY